MSASRDDFYQTHLDHVSRSFAFCIRQLPPPLRGWIGLSYLLCRIVDTIEDAQWESLDAQMLAFQHFDEALAHSEHIDRLKDWQTRFPDSLTKSERELMVDAVDLLRDFHELPAPIHEAIAELVHYMSAGMQHFCRTRNADGLRLKSLAEVNQYCFFVAGVVGELLAHLVAAVEPKFRLSRPNLLRAHHFGLFLQKVNLLKDQVGDEKQGRHLIPSRDLVEDSSQENAAQALDFLLDLPKEQIEFRRFCAWSLFLGLEALSVARNSIRKGAVLKVRRKDAEAVLEGVEQSLADDSALRGLFDSFARKLGWPKRITSVGPSDFPRWFLEVYRGRLDTQGLLELGITAGA